MSATILKGDLAVHCSVHHRKNQFVKDRDTAESEVISRGFPGR